MGNGPAMSEIAKYGVFVFPYGTSEYQLLHTYTSSTDIHHVFSCLYAFVWDHFES